MSKQPQIIRLESFTWNSPEEYLIKKSIRNLGSPFPEFVDDAEKVLKKTGKKCLPYFIEAIENDDLSSDTIKYILPEVLVLFKKDAVKFLIPYLDSENEDLAYAAESTIEEVGKAAVPILCDAIDTSNLIIKGKLIDLLGTIGDKKAIPTLIKCLSDPEESIRDDATWSLKELGSPCYNQVLPLLSSDDIHLVCAAVQILPAVDAKKGVPAVIPLFSHPDDEVYDTVFSSLVRLNTPPVDELVSHLQSDSVQVLFGILNVLANSKDTSAIEKITPLKEHPDTDVSETAEWAIGLILKSQKGEAE